MLTAIFLIGAVLCGVAFAPSAVAAAPERPNVVFFLVDDLGWRDLGCFGSTFYETPNADRLAREGMRFTDAYAACPVCSPTRASIMTGKYPARLATTDYFGAAQPEQWKRNTQAAARAATTIALPLAEITLAEAFKDAGYATFFAGKWHLGPEGFWPENQGFDVNRAAATAAGRTAAGSTSRRTAIRVWQTARRASICPTGWPPRRRSSSRRTGTGRSSPTSRSTPSTRR